MKRFFSILLVILLAGLLSGCVVSKENSGYSSRPQAQEVMEVSRIIYPQMTIYGDAYRKNMVY